MRRGQRTASCAVLSFYQAGFRDQAQVVRLGGKCRVLLNWAISQPQTRREAGERVGQLRDEDSKDSISVPDCSMTPL